MGRVLLLLPLLLLLLGLSPRGGPNPTLALDCDAADTVVREAQTRIVKTDDFEKIRSNGDLKLFVKAESGFRGVLLEVEESDGSRHTAWFPAEDCYPPIDSWQEFRAWAGTTATGFDLRLRSGACRKWCESTTPSRKPVSLSVVAYGPSKWITGKPQQGCDVTFDIGPSAKRLPTCQEPTHNTTVTPYLYHANSTYTTRPHTVIIVSLAAGLVVMAVVVVVVVVCWKRNSVKSPTEVRVQPQPAIPNRRLQLASVQGHAPQQYEEGHYYEILPNNTARRVVVQHPARINEPTYMDVMPERGVPPRPPAYQLAPSPGGVAAPHGHLQEATRNSHESHIYATVL